jgi:hypothetical protein
MTVRWRPEMRALFIGYLLFISVGLVFYFVVGLIAR